MAHHDRKPSRQSMLACAALSLGIQPVLAAGVRYDPKLLCTAAGYVDKEVLAKQLVEQDLGTPFLHVAPPPSQAPNAALLAALIRMGDTPCDQLGDACSERERSGSNRLMASLATFFTQPPEGFTLAAGATKENFFATPNGVNQLLCALPLPASVAASKDGPLASHLRVRGTPDDLVFSHREAEFKAAKPAIFSIDRDELTRTRTISSNAYLGFVWQESAHEMTNTSWLGYLGMVRSSTRVDGTDDPDRKLNQLHAGLIYDRHQAGAFRLSLRPGYFHDRVDGTEVVSVDAGYTPYWSLTSDKLKATNLFINYNAFAIRPVLRGKLHAGHFTGRSREPDTAAGQKNYLRAGAVLGFDLLPNDLPIEYHFSFTGLARLKGPSSIHYVTHALALSFDPHNYTSLLLDYSRGTNEETLRREKHWKLTFAFRY